MVSISYVWNEDHFLVIKPYDLKNICLRLKKYLRILNLMT